MYRIGVHNAVLIYDMNTTFEMEGEWTILQLRRITTTLPAPFWSDDDDDDDGGGSGGDGDGDGDDDDDDDKYYIQK